MLFAYLGCPVTRMHVSGGGRDAIFGCRETVMGRRNSHLETLRRTKHRFGGLAVNDEHVPHPMHACTATVRVELEQGISTFGVAP